MWFLHTNATVMSPLHNQKRPGVDYFLQWAKDNFGEVVLFCDSHSMDVQPLVEKLDPGMLLDGTVRLLLALNATLSPYPGLSSLLTTVQPPPPPPHTHRHAITTPFDLNLSLCSLLQAWLFCCLFAGVAGVATSSLTINSATARMASQTTTGEPKQGHYIHVVQAQPRR
jgi:hypothetical protein